MYKNPDNDTRGPWTSGDFSARNFYGAGTYPVTTPSGRVISGPPPGMYWRYSKENLAKLDADNRIWWGKDGSGVPRLKRFLSEVKGGRVPQTIWQYTEVGHTQEAKKEVVALNATDVFTTPKPERLIQRVLTIGTNPGDLVLDSFLGSGTTAAVAHKMGRRWIGIEMGEHAVTHCAPRLNKVIEGEQGGISQAVEWQGGGGFTFYRLGEEVFDADGRIRAGIAFASLAAHVWFSETGAALQNPSPSGEGRSREAAEGWGLSASAAASDSPHPNPSPEGDGLSVSPFLGTHDGRGYALLYNGVLGDKRPQGGNVLTNATLALIREAAGGFAGPMTVYGEASRLSDARLRAEGIIFKQTPYDVKAR